MLRTCQFLTILTSKSLSRAGGVQILRSSTSKSAPGVRCFNDFDFQIALARWRGANFCEAELPKVLPACGVLTILASKSLSRAGVVQILSASWAADPSHHFASRTYLCEPSKPQTMEKHSVSRNSYPPKSLMSRIRAVKHLCCQTSMLQDLPATFSIVGS